MNAKILNIPTLVSKPLPEIISMMAPLTCSGIILLTKLLTKSIDMSNEDARRTRIVSNGKIARNR